MAFQQLVQRVNKCLPFASLSHVQTIESTELEVWISQGSRDKEEEAVPGAVPRTMSGLSSLSAWTLSFSELAACPSTYPSPPASRVAQHGALSICIKFIRLPSVYVAIMAAPSCCSSKSAYGLWGPGAGAAKARECSQWLTLAAGSHYEKTRVPRQLRISAFKINTSLIVSLFSLLNTICQFNLKLDKKKQTEADEIGMFSTF